MKTVIKSDKMILPDGIFNGYVLLEDGLIGKISKEPINGEELYDLTGKYVSPGFIDIHTHGGGGFSFADSSAEEVIAGCDFHLTHGTTSILPTVSASAYANMISSLENIKAAMEAKKVKANILGAHLEGPYLSVAHCGAQCPDFITPPIKDEYVSTVKKYGKYIARWTYAPENDEGGEFCKYITDRGIIASAGHTDAKYKDMLTAIENGCNLVTHLYSTMSTVTRNEGYRSLGVIETAFLSDDLDVEIIADGSHLPHELIRMILKIKGCDKVILCTDSLSVAGSDIREGVMCGTEFIVEDGVAKLKSREAFAGSVATADVLIRTLKDGCSCPITDAVRMLTENPARLLGVNKGVIAEGKDADVIVFDENVNVSHVFVGGELVYEVSSAKAEE